MYVQSRGSVSDIGVLASNEMRTGGTAVCGWSRDGDPSGLASEIQGHGLRGEAVRIEDLSKATARVARPSVVLYSTPCTASRVDGRREKKRPRMLKSGGKIKKVFIQSFGVSPAVHHHGHLRPLGIPPFLIPFSSPQPY